MIYFRMVLGEVVCCIVVEVFVLKVDVVILVRLLSECCIYFFLERVI